MFQSRGGPAGAKTPARSRISASTPPTGSRHRSPVRSISITRLYYYHHRARARTSARARLDVPTTARRLERSTPRAPPTPPPPSASTTPPVLAARPRTRRPDASTTSRRTHETPSHVRVTARDGRRVARSAQCQMSEPSRETLIRPPRAPHLSSRAARTRTPRARERTNEDGDVACARVCVCVFVGVCVGAREGRVERAADAARGDSRCARECARAREW